MLIFNIKTGMFLQGTRRPVELPGNPAFVPLWARSIRAAHVYNTRAEVLEILRELADCVVLVEIKLD